MDRQRKQRLAQADKWIAGRAAEQGNVDVAIWAEARADEAVRELAED